MNMSKFTFTPEHFIESETGILLQLESMYFKKASVVNPEKIPKDREYIVVVARNVKVSKKFLKDTPDNVVFVINDSRIFCAADKNVRISQSRKCFYDRDGDKDAFTDSRFPGLLLRHLFYDGTSWDGDNLTLVEYFERIMPKKSLDDSSTTKWDTLFENAFKKGLALKEEHIENYLTKSMEAIPEMIIHDQKEKKIDDIPDNIVKLLNEMGLKNVKWSKGGVFSIDY